MKTFLPLAIIGATVMTAATSSAAITVTASSTAAGPNIGATNINATIATGWNLGSANTIAVYIGTENSAGGTFTATFAGQAMTVVQTVGGSNNHISGIAYLVNPTVTVGNVVIQATHSGAAGRHSYAWGILSLSGVDSVAGSDTRSTNGALSYTVGADGGFVLGNAVNNSFNYTAPPTITGNPDTVLRGAAFDGNASGLFMYGDAAPGSHNDTYAALAASTVAFNAIPEPSAALLGGTGILMLLCRRRN